MNGEEIREVIAAIALLFGVFFSFIGVLGIIRLPDAYSRLHASGKVGTMGQFGLLIGVGLLLPDTALRLLILGIFVIITAPVGSHVIAVAVHRFKGTKQY